MDNREKHIELLKKLGFATMPGGLGYYIPVVINIWAFEVIVDSEPDKFKENLFKELDDNKIIFAGTMEKLKTMIENETKITGEL